MSKIENIFKQTNIENIQNLKKDTFLKAFLIGHELYEDYIYLSKELPEMKDSLDLKGTWKDYQGNTKSFDENQAYFLGKTVKGCVYLLGEAKFLKDGTIDWLRYSQDFRFSRGDYLFCRNGKGYKGTLPEEENQNKELFESSYLFYEDGEGNRIDYDISKYSSTLTFNFEKITDNNKYIFKAKIFLNENNYEFYLLNDENERLEIKTNDISLDIFYKEIKKIYLNNKRTLNACIDIFEYINKNYDTIKNLLTT